MATFIRLPEVSEDLKPIGETLLNLQNLCNYCSVQENPDYTKIIIAEGNFKRQIWVKLSKDEFEKKCENLRHVDLTKADGSLRSFNIDFISQISPAHEPGFSKIFCKRPHNSATLVQGRLDEILEKILEAQKN